MSTLKVDNIIAYSGTHVSGTFSGVFSGSFDSSRIDALEAFSSSLDNTFATDLVVNSLSGAFNSFTAALDNTYATDAQLYPILQATRSLELLSGSLIGITNGLMAFTAALDSTYATDAQLYQLYQATASLNEQTGSQDLVNLGISSVTGSLIGITNGLMAFTAALDSTYATDAQLLPLLQATASLNEQTGSYATTGSNTFVGNETISGSILISGSIIPSVVDGGYTSSYSLGSSTNAWKELWVSNGSVNFVDPNSGDTASISLNERNVLSVPQIESVGNLNVTGSFGAPFITIGGNWDGGIGGDGGTLDFGGVHNNIIFRNSENNLGFYSYNSINFYTSKYGGPESKFNFTGSVKIHGDGGIIPGYPKEYWGVAGYSETSLEVVGNTQFSGSVYVSGSNSTIVLPNHSSAPTLPASGALYFDTTDFHFYGWNGGQWKQLDN